MYVYVYVYINVYETFIKKQTVLLFSYIQNFNLWHPFHEDFFFIIGLRHQYVFGVAVFRILNLVN